MKTFARHATHCPSCCHPYDIYRRGSTLCSKGHQRALDVAQYVYNKAGQAYSLVDREGNQRVQIEIPVGCEVVRELLKAMERGLRLMKAAPAVSYDETYYIAPRRAQSTHEWPAEREVRYARKPRLETAEPPAWYDRQQRREKPYYSGRGSLYEQDMKERERKFGRQQQPIYYTAAPRVPPPVPPKDHRWY